MFHLFSYGLLAVRSVLRPAWPTRVWACFAHALNERHRRAVANRELHSMDAYALRDLGLSHCAAAEWPHVDRDAVAPHRDGDSP